MNPGPSHPSPPAPGGVPGPRGQHAFQAPTGTRDFYPADLNRLRFIQDAWRRTAVAHGFDEIDGPTFEHLEVYTAKSGEGIVSELFSFERAGGEKTFALRPEFTPTLARMYAAKASSLPKPTKWFWTQNCFRAERPQRGRLREFAQWNVDVIGDESAQADAEVIACAVGLFEGLGLTPQDVQIRLSNRWALQDLLLKSGARADGLEGAYALLDKKAKLDREEYARGARALGIDLDAFERGAAGLQRAAEETRAALLRGESPGPDATPLAGLLGALHGAGVLAWCAVDFSIVRGLAYYTGTVWEAIAGGERAVAGGGRYDKLIEMFGGPPTPAVGFGMGDVVLSLVLEDRGLMPSEEQIADRLGLRPDAVVISAGASPEDQAAAAAAVAPTLAALRRAGLHVRRSYKTTRNVGKLIQDAVKMRARYCVILESATTATLKDLGTQGQETVGVEQLVDRLKRKDH